MSDCIFCKIAAHELGSDVVYEDDTVIAFRDLNPQAPVHVLVVPKRHFDSIIDDVPADVHAALIHAVSEVTRVCGIDKSGFRLIANTGEAAGQTVKHLHIHVLGGMPLGEGLLPAE